MINAFLIGTVASYFVSSCSAQTAYYPPLVSKCGIPNGDPDIFRSLQSTATYSKRSVRDSQKRRPGGNGLLDTPRLAGGSLVPGGSAYACWHVVLIVRYVSNTSSANFFGEGTLVGAQTILTSAFALAPYQLGDNSTATVESVTVTIGAGSIDAVSDTDQIIGTLVPGCARNFSTSKFAYHPDYNRAISDNDIGVITLPEPIDFQQYGNCACKLCLSRQTPSVGDNCIVSGIGQEFNETTPQAVQPLKYVVQNVVKPSYNACHFEGNATYRTNLDLFVCAGTVVGEGPCIYDDGEAFFCYSPTAQAQYLAGVSAVGQRCGDGRGTLYTKLALYVEWIIANSVPGDLSFIS